MPYKNKKKINKNHTNIGDLMVEVWDNFNDYEYSYNRRNL